MSDKVHPDIQEMIDKIDRGEKLEVKVTKLKVPIVNGKEDWDNAKTISTERRTV